MKNEEGKEVTRAELEAIFYYGGVALLLGGAAGIYIPFFMGKSAGVDAYATYVFAILAPVWVDALLYEPYWKKLNKVVKLRIGLLCAMSGIMAIIALLGEQKEWGIPLGLSAMALVLLIWFFLALYSGRFRPEPPSGRPPMGPLGGAEPSTDKLDGEGLPL